MATGIVQGRFQFQDGSKEELEASDLILLKGEIALETDEEGTTRIKRGDGKTKYVDLPYITIGEPGEDGSDATVMAGTGLTKSGSTISVNSSYVATKQDLKSYAKAADIPKIKEVYQEDYDKLSDKDPNTFYVIIEG